MIGLEPSTDAVACRHRNAFSVGGVSVEIVGDSAEDVTLVAQLQCFRAHAAISDIRIRVQRVPQLSPVPGERLFDSGTTWRLEQDTAGYRFDFVAPVFGSAPFKRLLIDRLFSCATLQISAQSFVNSHATPEPLGYPLDELLIMHRLTQEKAIELHGTGIVRPNGDANLFVGHSGAGKSTTTRLWTEVEEVEVLSDDRIIVRRDGSISERIHGNGASQHGIGVLRLRDCSASRSNLSAQDDKKHGMRMYGTPWHGEAMYASPNSAPLTRIFVLEHGHGNVITLLTPSQAVAELFARSFVPFHRHEYVESALSFLEELANAVPIYRYAFEPDQRAVDKIRHFHD